MQVTIYHNPKCAKSRETLKLLEAHGIEPIVIEYLKSPPSQTELAGLIKLLGIKPRALLRTKEPEYKQAGLDNPKLSDAAILQAMIKYPKLMERPIVVVGDVQGRTTAMDGGSAENAGAAFPPSAAGGRTPGAAKKAALGRPPQNVLKILK